MFVFGTLSYVFIAIILLGAYKCWMGVTHVLSKLFHQYEEPHVKKYAFIFVLVTVLLMVAPMIIPSLFFMREAVGILYILYGTTAAVQLYHWYQVISGKSKPAAPTSKPTDKTGK
jgi:hypothetical protein